MSFLGRWLLAVMAHLKLGTGRPCSERWAQNCSQPFLYGPRLSSGHRVPGNYVSIRLAKHIPSYLFHLLSPPKFQLLVTAFLFYPFQNNSPLPSKLYCVCFKRQHIHVVQNTKYTNVSIVKSVFFLVPSLPGLSLQGDLYVSEHRHRY